MDKVKNPWTTLKSQTVFENPWWKVQEDKVIRPDGKDGIYFVVDIKPGVYIVPIKDSKVLLIGQFRYPINHYSWEIPAGGSDGEEYQDAALRELWEETGYKSSNLKEVGKFYLSTGTSNEMGIAFLAQNLTLTDQHKQKEDGIDNLKWVDLDKVVEMIISGEIKDGATISALMYTFIHLNLIKL